MANTATGIIVGQAYSATTLGNYGDGVGYAGYSGSSYYTNAIKFTRPISIDSDALKKSGVVNLIAFV